ncbi:MAG: histidine phosphatase family protein [Fretibacterium sp.]|nr:histidine phosphatase family protein [Fretibacterium sp.]
MGLDGRRIVLARHGQTQWNQERRFQGSTNTPLNETGREQARALAARLSSWPMEVIYSSPLDRALYTASVVGERHGLSPIVLPELREVGFAGWEGQSIPELAKAGDFARWRADPFFNPPEGGETWGEILWRLSRAVETILEGPQRQILIVAHGGVMRGLYAVLAGMDPHKVWNMDFSNCAISGVEMRWGRPCLAFANDDLHIRGGEPGQRMPVW